MLDNIKELEIGKQQQIQLLIKNAEPAFTRTGEEYQKLTVRDANDHETILFNFKEKVNGKFPMVINATVDTSEFRESACSKLLTYEFDPNSKPESFLPKAQIDRKEALQALGKMQISLRPCLRSIVREILNQNVKAFSYYPFSKTGIFSRTCGILEATYRLTLLAEQTSKVIGLDHDLMVSGAMLYYIGKVDTMDCSYNNTEDDVLLGSGFSAAVMVQTKAKELIASNAPEMLEETSKKDIKLLTHILSSRFKGIPAATPEANALRYLDALVTDTEAIKNIQNNGVTGSTVSDKTIYSNRVYCV